MNRYRVFWVLLCSAVISSGVNAQGSIFPIEPVNVFISDSFTSTLLFPYAIKKASWCSPHFAVQQTREVANMLEIKSTEANFPTSNLSVVTSDGHFYSFLIYYDPEPYHLTYRFGKDAAVKQSNVVFTAEQWNDAELERLADSVAQQPSFIRRKYRSHHLKGRLQGIYSHGNITWMNVQLKNRQSVPINIYHAALTINDKSTIQYGIERPHRIDPVYCSAPIVLEQQKQTIVIGIPQTILAKRKRLHIQLQNEAGVQLLECKIPYHLLLKSQPLRYAEH